MSLISTIHPATFWKMLLPRPGLEPTPPDFQSGMLPTTYHWAKVVRITVWEVFEEPRLDWPVLSVFISWYCVPPSTQGQTSRPV